jgi:hypothetical protein
MKVVEEEELVAAASQDSIKEDINSTTSAIKSTSLEKSSMYAYKEDH